MRTLFAGMVLLFVGLAVFLFFAKDLAAKMIFESVVSRLTTLEARAEKVRFDFRRGALHVEELLLQNPAGFEKKVFGDAHEVYLEMDVPALLRKEQVHLKELRLNVREFNVEKNRAGISNVSLLSALWKRPSAPPSPAGTRKKMPFRLDRFVLTMRRVRYHDRSGLVPKKLSVDARVEKQVFEGITDPKAILNIIVMKAVSKSPIGTLGVNLSELQNHIKSGVRSVRELGTWVYKEVRSAEFTERGGEVGKKILTNSRSAMVQVGSTATEEITDLFGKFRTRRNGTEPDPSS